MKALVWVLVVLMSGAPAWAAGNKMTVQQLKELLVSMQQNNGTDAAVAAKLKQTQLSEELTRSFVVSLGSLLPGPRSEEQVEILKGQSAFLPPPASDIPTVPVPEAAAQKAILDKAAFFASKTYTQNPHLSVIKATFRYEDDLVTTNSIGLHSPQMVHRPVQFVENHQDAVETDRGVEKPAASRTNTNWGENGRISEGEPGTNLGVIFPEVMASGKIEWLRWQTIEGRQTAVFSFTVEKKKSHFAVNYCCFPTTSYTNTGSLLSSNGSTVNGVNDWEPFKKVVGYHGEFFVDPDSGAIRRLITQAEMKPSDFVFREDRRVDYDRVMVDGKEYLLPRASETVTEGVPNGESAAITCTNRQILFQVLYQNYKLAGH